jgi:lysozyme family protein
MRGITLGTYTRWRQQLGQQPPTKDDLRNITDAEVNRIYFEWYWLTSGSDKLEWPLCLCHFDTSVNAGPGRAAEMLAKSNGNFIAYMGHLIDWYTRINNFETFGRAWIRRRAEILLEAAK